MKTNDSKSKNLVYLIGNQTDKPLISRSESFGIGLQRVQTGVNRYTNANDNRSKKRTPLILIIRYLQGYENDCATIMNDLTNSLPVLCDSKSRFLPFALLNARPNHSRTLII